MENKPGDQGLISHQRSANHPADSVASKLSELRAVYQNVVLCDTPPQSPISPKVNLEPDDDPNQRAEQEIITLPQKKKRGRPAGSKTKKEPQDETMKTPPKGANKKVTPDAIQVSDSDEAEISDEDELVNLQKLPKVEGEVILRHRVGHSLEEELEAENESEFETGTLSLLGKRIPKKVEVAQSESQKEAGKTSPKKKGRVPKGSKSTLDPNFQESKSESDSNNAKPTNRDDSQDEFITLMNKPIKLTALSASFSILKDTSKPNNQKQRSITICEDRNIYKKYIKDPQIGIFTPFYMRDQDGDSNGNEGGEISSFPVSTIHRPGLSDHSGNSHHETPAATVYFSNKRPSYVSRSQPKVNEPVLTFTLLDYLNIEMEKVADSVPESTEDEKEVVCGDKSTWTEPEPEPDLRQLLTPKQRVWANLKASSHSSAIASNYREFLEDLDKLKADAIKESASPQQSPRKKFYFPQDSVCSPLKSQMSPGAWHSSSRFATPPKRTLQESSRWIKTPESVQEAGSASVRAATYERDIEALLEIRKGPMHSEAQLLLSVVQTFAFVGGVSLEQALARLDGLQTPNFTAAELNRQLTCETTR